VEIESRGQNGETVKEFGRYRFDSRAGVLHRNGRSIELNPKCAATLTYLVDHGGSVVSKDELLAAVWPEGAVEPNNVPQTVYVLRRTFKIAGDDDEFIATIPGRGYRFVPAVRVPPAAMRSSHKGLAWLRPTLAAIAAVVTCAAVYAALRSEKPIDRSGISEEGRVAYQQGRFYWSRRSTQSLKIALQRFESAIAMDPQYAQAYSGLADTYSIMGMVSNSSSESTRYWSLARDSAGRSVSLDSTCAECHASLAFTYEDGRHRQKVSDEFQTAIRLDPNYATAHEWYGWYLFRWNDKKGALAEMRRAAELDPTSPIINLALGWQLFYDRQFDAALTAFTDVSTLDPTSDYSLFGIALVQEQGGRTDDALKTIDRAIALNPDSEYGAERARLLAKAHRQREAQATLARLLSQRPKPFYYIALMYDALEQRKLALQYLKLAKKRHDVAMEFVMYDPRVDDLRISAN
jgi:DNA-binding winged helix-turn-helix (wHTH) protein/Tfp pilus assembly protein PilF